MSVRTDVPVLSCDVYGCDGTFAFRTHEDVLSTRNRARASGWRRGAGRDSCNRHLRKSSGEPLEFVEGVPQLSPGAWSARSELPLAVTGTRVQAACDANTVRVHNEGRPLVVVTSAVVTDTGGWFVQRQAAPAPPEMGQLSSVAEFRMAARALGLLSEALAISLWTDSTYVATNLLRWALDGVLPRSWDRDYRPARVPEYVVASVRWASRSTEPLAAADKLCRQALGFEARPPAGSLSAPSFMFKKK